jgi:GWxTD domain-containing protein
MKKFFLYTLIVFAIITCGATIEKNKKSLPTGNKSNVASIHPEFVVFNVSDSVSELYFKIRSRELLYMRPDGINFSSNVLISCRLLPSYDSKTILDSSSVHLIDTCNDDADKYLIGKMNVKAVLPKSYYLRVKITDLNKNVEVTNVITLEKYNPLNRQNFLVKIKKTNTPLFHNYTKSNEELVINYRSKISVILFVSYYHRNFPLAAPPFAVSEPKTFQFKPDSTFTIQLTKDGTVDFTATKKGIYHFQLDSTKREGLTLFNFSETFPEIKKAEDLVPPLRFITSKQEFEELITSDNPKAAIEKFWITCTGNQDRAREVIRKYYNRVKDANLFYTSYLEGWKTDRGIIYLIYGTPNVIYRTENVETWTYGEESNINSISYAFLKVDNPFTDNDFGLERSVVYRQSWGTAVDVWRQGRTYLQD